MHSGEVSLLKYDTSNFCAHNSISARSGNPLMQLVWGESRHRCLVGTSLHDSVWDEALRLLVGLSQSSVTGAVKCWLFSPWMAFWAVWISYWRDSGTVVTVGQIMDKHQTWILNFLCRKSYKHCCKRSILGRTDTNLFYSSDFTHRLTLE